jgi:hypothetical protein
MKRQLRDMLIAVAFAGVLAAVLFWPTPRRSALARVEELNGVYHEDPAGDGRTLAIVGFISQPVTDADLVILKDIRPLHRVLLDGTKITNSGLVHLEGIEELEFVSVCGTAVTDDGLVHLARIPTLKEVFLRKTRVTDAGLEHLLGLPRLSMVDVTYSLVTQAGASQFRRKTPGVNTVSEDDD